MEILSNLPRKYKIKLLHSHREKCYLFISAQYSLQLRPFISSLSFSSAASTPRPCLLELRAMRVAKSLWLVASKVVRVWFWYPPNAKAHLLNLSALCLSVTIRSDNLCLAFCFLRRLMVLNLTCSEGEPRHRCVCDDQSLPGPTLPLPDLTTREG